MNAIKISLLVALLVFVTETRSQNRSPSTIYLEIGGNALVYSINYDRMITDNFGMRAGIIAFAVSSGSEGAATIGIPVLANFLLGDGEHRMELGFGFTYLGGAIGGKDVYGEISAISPTGFIGYRYQPMDGGFFFKIGFTPFKFSDKFFPWGGLGIGYTLN